VGTPASGIYHPRNVKASPLYGLVEDHFDRFADLYDEQFAPTHGYWRPVIRTVAEKFLDCGDLRHGFARIRCENPDCRHEMLLAFSCRGRYFCPSCHAKRVALFSTRLETEILADVPHRQYVFTIPKLLRLHFRFDRRLLGLLSGCAWRAVLQMMRAVIAEPQGVPGMVASIQTYGDQAANWHPHCHAIVSDGLFLPDGAFCPLPPLDPTQLMLLFRHHLLRQLLQREKITETSVEILDRFRRPGFSAFQGSAIQPQDTAGREKLGVYILHPPIALQRLDYQPGQPVLVQPSQRAIRLHAPLPKNAAPDGSLLLDPLECLAALTDHIPDPGQHLVRFFGWYSNKTRGVRKKQTAQLVPAASWPAATDEPLAQPDIATPDERPDDAWHKECRRTWARLIQKVYEVDPLICPRCGFPMRILAVIDDPPVVRRILDCLGLWNAQPRSPPAQACSNQPVSRLPRVAEDPPPYDDLANCSEDPA
jgi:hypothetical protein